MVTSKLAESQLQVICAQGVAGVGNSDVLMGIVRPVVHLHTLDVSAVGSVCVVIYGQGSRATVESSDHVYTESCPRSGRVAGGGAEPERAVNTCPVPSGSRGRGLAEGGCRDRAPCGFWSGRCSRPGAFKGGLVPV